MARVTGGARERAARSLLWTALESGAISGLAFAALVVFGWTLTPAELGIGALAFSVVQLLNLPVELLFHDALIQRREIDAPALQHRLHRLPRCSAPRCPPPAGGRATLSRPRWATPGRRRCWGG